MKRMYWRPRRVSRVTLALVAAASMAGYVAVEQFPQRVRESNHAEKLEAARKAEAAFKAIREERIRRKLEIDLEADPDEMDNLYGRSPALQAEMTERLARELMAVADTAPKPTRMA